MVDNGSSTDVLYLDAFQKLSLIEKDLSPMSLALTGFMEDSISPLDTTTLLVTISEEPRSKTMMVTFTVVWLPLVYHIILNYLTLNKLRAIVSTYYRMIKFPTHARTGEGPSRIKAMLPNNCHATQKAKNRTIHG